MDEATFSAGLAHTACSLPVWEEANFKAALPPTKPMSHALLAILLMIGCVESNPGPSSDGVGSADSASASVLPLLQTRLSAGRPVERGGRDSSMEDSRMEVMATGDSPPSDRPAAGPLPAEPQLPWLSSGGAIAAGQGDGPPSHAPYEDSANQWKDPYEPTSPTCSPFRTSDAILATQAASDKRRRTGNGKGVCKQMLETTLGEYYGVMSKDAVVRASGQHPPSKGAATGYLAELHGKRVAITDETSPGERVDLGLVLMMTGGGKVTSRLLYQNNVSFRFTHTPFIQTNYDPEIPPILAKQPNIDRRLIVVRFRNEYVSDNKFDEMNPNHRHVDVGLKERMETPSVREEFLTFLVKGSQAWYEDPTVLRQHPPAVQAASVAWLRRGDMLQTFLQSEHCEKDPEDTPDSVKSVTWEDDFWTQFQQFAGIKMAKEELARQMREKGFVRTKRAGRFSEPSKQSSCYVGFKCEYI